MESTGLPLRSTLVVRGRRHGVPSFNDLPSRSLPFHPSRSKFSPLVPGKGKVLNAEASKSPADDVHSAEDESGSENAGSFQRNLQIDMRLLGDAVGNVSTHTRQEPV